LTSVSDRGSGSHPRTVAFSTQDSSFPSSHAQTVATLSSFLFLEGKDHLPYSVWVSASLVTGVLTLLTGFSRAYLAMHFASDVRYSCSLSSPFRSHRHVSLILIINNPFSRCHFDPPCFACDPRCTLITIRSDLSDAFASSCGYHNPFAARVPRRFLVDTTESLPTLTSRIASSRPRPT